MFLTKIQSYLALLKKIKLQDLLSVIYLKLQVSLIHSRDHVHYNWAIITLYSDETKQNLSWKFLKILHTFPMIKNRLKKNCTKLNCC